MQAMPIRFVSALFVSLSWFLTVSPAQAKATWSWDDLTPYQETLTRAEAQTLMDAVMVHQSAAARTYVSKFITLTDEALVARGKDGQERFRLRFGTHPKPTPDFQWNGQDLTGLRVAIDPSNDRWQRLTQGEQSFFYPDLTRATALELARLLKEAHAEVVISRPERDHKYSLTDVVATMNSFSPHIALAAHFNAGRPDNADKGRGNVTFAPAVDNVSVVFTPGAFMAGELDEERWLFRFVHGLVSGKASQSIALGKKIVEKLQAEIGVAGQDVDQHGDRRHTNPLYDQDAKPLAGVAARNLFINQVIAMAVVYCMPVYLDNPSEFTKMAAKDFTIGDTTASARAQAIAQAYFAAISEYAQGLSAR